MKRFLSVLIAVVLFHVSGTAQIISDPTTWTFETKKINDSTFELQFHCKLKPEWHLWSLNPGGDGLLLPPSFEFAKNKNIRTLGEMKERGTLISKEFPGTDGITHYYENEVHYSQKVQAKANTTLHGSVRYQCCDHSQCLAPKDKDFEFTISGVPESRVAQETESDTVGETQEDSSALSKGDTASKQVNSGTKAVTSSEDQRSNIMLLLEGMGGGLFAIITPCVFAMLPMTVSFFLKRTKDRKSGIRVALQYSLSLLLIFMFLGGVLFFVNNGNILYEISSHWITNLFFFIIFIIFGIAFLGAFEITLPARWSTFTDSKANLNSWSGIFFMALTLAIVSFSCTGPFLGFLISEISKGARIGPLVGFTGFGLGLALPFTLFAMFPQLLTALNKQGGWLNAVKVVFGFIELALAFKFLSNADLQLHWRLLDREIFIAIWVVISLALSFYLFGFIRFSHDSEMPKNDWGLPYLTVTRLLF
ncbi:MAG TPA: cytochrome c biogenesis protein CcdA, partial [Chitinophagaceae bacterium]|nr:cytochrome c biogenesis protein CcdA [Chitinophagaceae bacterium]